MKTRIIVSAAALCLGWAAVSVAQDNPIARREQMMKEIGGSMASLAGIAKGDKPFDADVVRTALTTIHTNIKAFPDQFPDGSELNSAASPAIWDNNADFRARAAKLEGEAGTILASMPADQAGVQKAVQTLGSNCGACHQTYRLKR